MQSKDFLLVVTFIPLCLILTLELHGQIRVQASDELFCSLGSGIDERPPDRIQALMKLNKQFICLQSQGHRDTR